MADQAKPMDYALLKLAHVSSVVVSGCGFLLRGLWMMQGSPLLQRRWVRVVPHIVDTVLLASALALVILTRQYPWTHGWVLAKILALLLYITLGMMALRRGRTPAIRIASTLGAVLTFGYIVSVALTRDPLGVLRLL